MKMFISLNACLSHCLDCPSKSVPVVCSFRVLQCKVLLRQTTTTKLLLPNAIIQFLLELELCLDLNISDLKLASKTKL